MTKVSDCYSLHEGIAAGLLSAATPGAAAHKSPVHSRPVPAAPAVSPPNAWGRRPGWQLYWLILSPRASGPPTQILLQPTTPNPQMANTFSREKSPA